ncbi:MAG: CCA tRNA nucleotidyltransferase [Deltaproteobacteria bacterium]|nr:CCA tRNA nucleotidyltransferase [Deltaproteobacteria bacterium]
MTEQLTELLRRRLKRHEPLFNAIRCLADSVGGFSSRTSVATSVYLVGGFVRDLFLEAIFSRPAIVRDIDAVITGMPSNGLSQLAALMARNFGGIRSAKCVESGFPVMKIYLRDFPGVIDVALARGREVSTGPLHRDFRFDIDGVAIDEDLQRRDFTMNAVALRLKREGEDLSFLVEDPVRGIGDMERRCIRAIGIAGDRFFEDPIRQIRAVRFACQLSDAGFAIDAETLAAIRRVYPETFRSIPQEPLTQETGRALKADAIGLFRLFRETGIASLSFPLFSSLGDDQIQALQKTIAVVGDDLDENAVWAPLLFLVARRRLASQWPIGDAPPDSAFRRVIEPAARSLRLPGEIVDEGLWLSRLWLHAERPYPLTLLENFGRWMKDRPSRRRVLSLYGALATAQGLVPADVDHHFRSIESRSFPLSREELRGFFQRHAIGQGPAREAMIRHARESHLQGRCDSKEECMEEALRYHRSRN